MAELDVNKAHVSAQWSHGRPLVSCRIDPKGRFVFAGSEDHSVLRFEIPSGKKTVLAGHESWVHALAFTPDGSQLITGGCDGRMIWWPVAEEPKALRRIDAHRGWVRTLAVSPDGKLVASGGNDHRVRLWNVADGKLVRELAGHQRNVYSVLFTPDGRHVLSGDLVGVLHQWEVGTGKLVRSFTAKPLHTYEGGQMVDFGGVRALAMTPDGKQLAAGGLHKATNPLGAVHEPLELLFEFESQKLLRSHVADGIAGGVVWRTLFLKDQTLMAVSGGSSGGFLLFWKPNADKAFFQFKLPSLARDMDLHPDGVRVATAHHDGHVRISTLTKPA